VGSAGATSWEMAHARVTVDVTRTLRRRRRPPSGR
jgi:hypothetical protein